MPDDVARRPKASFRSLAALITAVGALLGSITAFIRATDESVTKSSYETLAAGISSVDNKCMETHEQLAALRAYMDGYVRGPIPSVSDAGVTSASTELPPPPHAPTKPPRPTAHPITATAPSSSMMPSYAPAPAAPLPAFPPPAAAWQPPPFDSVQKKAARGD